MAINGFEKEQLIFPIPKINLVKTTIPDPKEFPINLVDNALRVAQFQNPIDFPENSDIPNNRTAIITALKIGIVKESDILKYIKLNAIPLPPLELYRTLVSMSFKRNNKNKDEFSIVGSENLYTGIKVEFSKNQPVSFEIIFEKGLDENTFRLREICEIENEILHHLGNSNPQVHKVSYEKFLESY